MWLQITLFCLINWRSMRIDYLFLIKENRLPYGKSICNFLRTCTSQYLIFLCIKGLWKTQSEPLQKNINTNSLCFPLNNNDDQRVNLQRRIIRLREQLIVHNRAGLEPKLDEQPQLRQPATELSLRLFFGHRIVHVQLPQATQG